MHTLRRSEGFCEEIEQAQSRGGNVENDDDDGENQDDHPKPKRKQRLIPDVTQNADRRLATFRTETRIEHFRTLG